MLYIVDVSHAARVRSIYENVSMLIDKYYIISTMSFNIYILESYTRIVTTLLLQCSKASEKLKFILVKF